MIPDSAINPVLLFQFTEKFHSMLHMILGIAEMQSFFQALQASAFLSADNKIPSQKNKIRMKHGNPGKKFFIIRTKFLFMKI